RLDSPQTVRMVSHVGKREARHCSAVGKALLAHLDDDDIAWIVEVKGLPRFTSQTITDPAALRDELERVRRQGYAIDDQEGEEGIRCVGAPIFDWAGQPVAAISVAAPVFRTPIEKLHAVAPALLDAAAAISQRLGYRGRSVARPPAVERGERA
ncbi:MAG TPA: IclR family transcriptional regulator C-terminal domain-containing protein, partial [Limnochordia bacterium]